MNDNNTPNGTVFDGGSVFDFGDVDIDHEYDPGTVALDDDDEIPANRPDFQIPIANDTFH